MAYIGNKPGSKYATLTRQTFSTPTGTSHTLSQTVTNSDDLLLYINNVKQNPADYTASGTTLTTASLAGGTEMYCLYYGKTTETVAPPASSVGDSHIVDMAASKLTGTVADARISTLTASKLTGALPAISGASLTGIDGGDKQNFIVDGDFTQWPAGTTFASPTSNTYTATFFKTIYTGSGVLTVNRSTDVPTIAQSGYASSYSFETDVTTADGTIAGADQYYHNHQMTGSIFAQFAQQEVTLSFWHKHTKTGTHCVGFSNGDQDRSYVAEYTQTTTNTWEKASITLTMDTSGTWRLGHTEKGLEIKFAMAYSTAGTWAQSANSWQAGHAYTTSNQVNNFDSTSNYFRISQLQLKLGSSAPTFTSPPIATVKDQVHYYIQRYDYDTIADQPICVAYCQSSSQGRGQIFYPYMRINPTTTTSAAGSFKFHESDGTNQVVSSINNTESYQTYMNITVTLSSTALGGARMRRDSSDTCYKQLDARH